MEPKLSKEIILRGNTAVIREVFETEVGDVGNILMDSVIEPKYQFLPMMLPPLHAEWVEGTILGSTPTGNKLLAFVKVNYFPMQQSYILRKRNNRESEAQEVTVMDDYYYYTGNPTETEKPNIRAIRDYIDTSYPREGNPAFSEDNVKKLPNGRWNIPESHTLWYMLSYENGALIEAPKIFMLNEDFVPLVPYLPNTHHDGKVCTGEDYSIFNAEDTHPLMKISRGIKCLHDAPPNNDLRNASIEQKYVRWDLEGNQIEVPLEDTFFRSQVTDERVLEFCHWYKKGLVHS